ncbi:terpene synthase family protein [Rubrobacter indicoceani]|uniref:terpene synthase family protein n=1 Tax=Rubrobacter indicoceani TaxID=2051957 RepID=UPI000E5C1F31|nr:hypothetical protein [Rubrobacter indicoceani]
MSESRVEFVEVPGIVCGLEKRISPHAAEVQELHVRWCERHGVYDSEKIRRVFIAMDIGNLASRMYPSGRLEDVQLIADWSAWLLLRDDRWDVTESLAEWERLANRDRAYIRLMRRGNRASANGPEDSGDALYRGLQDLCERTRRRALENSVGDPINGAFLKTMAEFFRGSVRQSFLQRRGETPSLLEYTELRRITGGLDILTHTLAATDGISLSGGALSGTLVERLRLAADNVCCWHNDLVSLNKELAGGEVNNLSIVLAEDPSVPCASVREGLDLAVKMVYDEQAEFERVKTLLLERGGPQAATVKWYIGMLEERISGIISWQERCARYQGFV